MSVFSKQVQEIPDRYPVSSCIHEVELESAAKSAAIVCGAAHVTWRHDWVSLPPDILLYMTVSTCQSLRGRFPRLKENRSGRKLRYGVIMVSAKANTSWWADTAVTWLIFSLCNPTPSIIYLCTYISRCELCGDAPSDWKFHRGGDALTLVTALAVP